MPFKTKQMVLVFGIRRSGNHVIADWIEGQYAAQSRVMFRARNVQLDFFSFLDGVQLKNGFCDCAVFGIEEHPIHAVDIAYSKDAQDIIKLVLLRDPYNLFASRIRHYRLDESPYLNGGFATYNWLDYAKFFTNPSKGVICVSYNRFLVDPSYRKALVYRLGIDFDSRSDTALINRVNDFGGGSSFDGIRYDRKGSRMKVFNRWEWYKDNADYIALFSDEIKRLSGEIFNFNPF